MSGLDMPGPVSRRNVSTVASTASAARQSDDHSSNIKTRGGLLRTSLVRGRALSTSSSDTGEDRHTRHGPCSRTRRGSRKDGSQPRGE